MKEIKELLHLVFIEYSEMPITQKLSFIGTIITILSAFIWFYGAAKKRLLRECRSIRIIYSISFYLCKINCENSNKEKILFQLKNNILELKALIKKYKHIRDLLKRYEILDDLYVIFKNIELYEANEVNKKLIFRIVMKLEDVEHKNISIILLVDILKFILGFIYTSIKAVFIIFPLSIFHNFSSILKKIKENFTGKYHKNEYSTEINKEKFKRVFVIVFFGLILIFLALNLIEIHPNFIDYILDWVEK